MTADQTPPEPPEDVDQVDVEQQPAPWDPMADLTLAELRAGSKSLGASIVRAVSEQTEDYEQALAVVTWLVAKRTDPRANLGTFTSCTWQQLHERLEAMRPVEDPEGPTDPGPG